MGDYNNKQPSTNRVGFTNNSSNPGYRGNVRPRVRGITGQRGNFNHRGSPVHGGNSCPAPMHYNSGDTRPPPLMTVVPIVPWNIMNEGPAHFPNGGTIPTNFIGSQRGNMRFPHRGNFTQRGNSNNRGQSSMRKSFSMMNLDEEEVVPNHSCTDVMYTLKCIQQLLKCCKCLKDMREVITCARGHGICKQCKRDCNKSCPICSSAVLDVKPVLLNGIISLLPRSCKFSGEGCEAFLLASDEDHEVFCKYRKVPCRMPNCDWKDVAKDLLLHLEKFHGREMIREASSTQVLMGFNTRHDRDGMGVIVAFNNIFWQYIKVQKNILMHFYQLVPMEKPTKEYSVKVRFHTPDLEYSSATLARMESLHRNQMFKEKDIFRLPKNVATDLSQYNGGVHYSITITQSKLPSFKDFEKPKPDM